MIPQSEVNLWRKCAPWRDELLIEQDLLLSRAIIEIFSIAELKGKLVLVGGNAIHKILARPAARHSSDIDLLQTHDQPIHIIIESIRNKLDAAFGEPYCGWTERRATVVYTVESHLGPLINIKIEISRNNNGDLKLLQYCSHTFFVNNGWFTGSAVVATEVLEEILSLKIRWYLHRKWAQKRAVDIFDIWLCIHRGATDLEQLSSYMKHHLSILEMSQFRLRLQNTSAEFSGSITMTRLMDLLPIGVEYNALDAHKEIAQCLLPLLPDV